MDNDVTALIHTLSFERPPVSLWFAPETLISLAEIRDAPGQWGELKARAKQQGVNPWDLEKAVDASIVASNGHVTLPDTNAPAAEPVSAEAQVDQIVSSRDPKVWYSGESLACFAAIRQQPAVWGYVKAMAGRVNIFPRDLEKAVDALVGLQRPDRQSRGKTEVVSASASLEQRSTANVLEFLTECWRLPITEVIRHGTEGGTFHLRLATGIEIALGTSETVVNDPKKVRGAIYAATGNVIPRYGAKEADAWDEIAGMLSAVARLIETPELTRLGQIRALLLSYLASENCQLDREASAEDWEILAERNSPYVRGGLVHIHVRTTWLRHVRIVAPDISYAALLDMCRLLGATRVTIALNTYKTSRSLWVFLPALLEEPAE